MNQLLLVVAALMALQQLNQANVKVDESLWQSFKSQHGKEYRSSQEDDMRKLIFTYNKHLIDQHNKQQAAEAGFELGHNHLMDLTETEIKARNGFKGHAMTSVQNDEQAEKFLAKILEDKSEVPAEVDWRKVPGRVSRVKDQGECGSCWAFASTGVLEGQEAVRNPKLLSENGTKLVELSEQNLVDCTSADYGCSGGIMSDGLAQVRTEGGIESEDAYPYLAEQQQCRFNKSKSVFSDQGYAVLPSGDEEKLKQVVAKFGPVAVGIDASSLLFRFYVHGVYYNKHCKNELQGLDHGVLVVGYGHDEKGGDYWIVKNSWNENYGEDGYIKMARNRNNNCGIATVATIPTF